MLLNSILFKFILNFEEEIENYNQRKIATDKFLKMIEKYIDLEELTVPIINEYIEKFVVYEAYIKAKEYLSENQEKAFRKH